jgi:cbb3-type cytochrome oxidase subunit 3
MHKELLQQSPLLVLPLVALLLFFGVFVAVSIRTYVRRAKTYDAAASLPLDEESPQ